MSFLLQCCRHTSAQAQRCNLRHGVELLIIVFTSCCATNISTKIHFFFLQHAELL